MRDAMVHRFKLHYLKITSRDWNMKKEANFHFNTLFYESEGKTQEAYTLTRPNFVELSY